MPNLLNKLLPFIHVSNHILVDFPSTILLSITCNALCLYISMYLKVPEKLLLISISHRDLSLTYLLYNHSPHKPRIFSTFHIRLVPATSFISAMFFRLILPSLLGGTPCSPWDFCNFTFPKEEHTCIILLIVAFGNLKLYVQYCSIGYLFPIL